MTSRAHTLLESRFRRVALAVFALFGSGCAQLLPCGGDSCATRCETSDDCADAESCENGLCRAPTCQIDGDCPDTWSCESHVCMPPPGDPGDGVSPGLGRAYVLDSLAIDDTRDNPMNALWVLGTAFNDSIRQRLLGALGRVVLVELAGADEAFPQIDSAVSVRTYMAVDFDDPPFPANNFQVPMGQTECCQFTLDRRSLGPNGTPLWLTGGSIIGGLLTTIEGNFGISWTTSSSSSEPLETVEGHLRARVRDNGLTEGVIEGAIPAQTLGRIYDPLCKTPNTLCPRQLPDSTLLDIVANFNNPDLDLDLDGLETIETSASGRVERCYDGDGTLLPPVARDKAWTCALHPEMADGYSVVWRFSAVRATVVGR
ncbi:MAG: hypothetical protein HYV07_07220 [Deltaproteobacteria bacterium]|nr:hypothetical protein [Deltaproteobacteria bacterium]